MKFLDEVKIYLKSGDGGPGCVSFRREKFIEYGGPDGGNGGKGGDIIFQAVANLNTLIDFRYTQHFKAKNGMHGMGRNRSGHAADDLIIKVPVGTEMIDEDGETLIADFTQDGQTLLFLKGGDGGFGNAHYKTATNQAPRKFTPGWTGMERWVWLRLKLIADIGIIGLPNAGKSTFLAATSAAKPKIADYPFTTLHPNLGVVKIGDGSFVLADIPGLIEGASEGVGLGHKFLAHIERTAALLHLIDATQDDVCAAYDTIRAELAAYDAGLEDKDEIIALNKCDALDDSAVSKKQADLAAHTGKTVHTISAVAKTGVTKLAFELSGLVEQAKTKTQ